MSKIIRALVEPKMLIWARQYAYLPKEEAANRIHVALDKLNSWEEGNSSPTINQLHTIARVYRQSFAVFYLQTPPKPIKLPIRDYRRLPGEGTSNISYEFAIEVRTAINRRDISLELAQELNTEIPEINLTLTLSDHPQIYGDIIRRELGIQFKNQKKWRDSRIAFNNWRYALEKFGVLVFQSSILDLHLARGFSIGDFPLPVIVVNRKDTYTGRIFSLLHELSHILLRASGIWEREPDLSLPPEYQEIEIYCNQLSAEILMPRSEFSEEFQSLIPHNSISEITDSRINSIASSFSVSREAAVRRMVSLGFVPESFYEDKRREYLKQYRKIPKSSGFVPPATNVISIAGQPYASLVINAFDMNIITSSDVYNYLGVRPKHISQIGEKVGVR